MMKLVTKALMGLIVPACLAGVTVLAQEATNLPNPRIVKDRPLKVAYMRLTLAWASGIRPYMQLHIEGAKRKWEFTYVTDIEDVAKERDAVDSVINQNVDAIIIDNFQIHQFPDLVLKARQKEIGVYCLDTPLVPGALAETTMPNGVFSAEMTYWGIDKLQGTGGFALIGWELTDWGVQRTFPIKVLMEKCFPDIKFLAYQTPNAEHFTDDAFAIASAWMQKFGKKLNWIHTPFDGIAMPVARAVQQAGFTRKDCMVTGIDAGVEACQMIKEGAPLAATYGQFFEAYAHYICEVIDQVQIHGIMPATPGSLVPVGRVLRFPGMLVDEHNVPKDGQTAYALHNYDGLDPNDPNAWVNWYKAVNLKPYTYDYPKKGS